MKVFKFVGAFAGLVFLFSCSTVNNSKISKNPTMVKPQQTSQTLTPAVKNKSTNKKPETAAQNKKAKLIFVPMPSSISFGHMQKKASIFAEGSSKQGLKNGIKISVENMPINKFINLIFNKTLKVSYFIDKAVQKNTTTLTLKMENPMPPDKFLKMITFILSGYNVSIREKNGMLYIIPGRLPPKKTVPPIFVGSSLPEYVEPTDKVGIIVPLYYAKAINYSSLVKQISLSSNATILVLPKTNDLMIIDMASRIREALKIIKLFDRPSFENKKAALMMLEYLSPSDFIKKLKTLLSVQGIPVAAKPSDPGIILIPMSELNGVLIITPKTSWINIVKYWKDKLDIITALGERPHLFVFYPKNRRAKDLADILSKFGRALVSKNQAKKGKGSTGAFAANGEIKVAVDSDRNALVVLATPSQYKQIQQVLKKLDTLPKQVLVQVTIAEVTLTDNLQYGIEWYLRHTGRWNGNLQTLGHLGIGASGITYSVISNTSKFQALLNAYAHKNLINVLSSPRIVVLDNKEASINVGTQVPTLTSTASNSTVSDNGTSALVSTIQYRKTGVILHIKPTINSNGILTMTISQEVSQPQTNNVSKIDSPLILDRSISTSVVLKSGSTLLLGGLIKKTKSNTVSKVPLLGDIPLLGNIFKTTSKSTVKTELIIEITPYILSSTAEGVKATQRFESLLKWFHEE